MKQFIALFIATIITAESFAASISKSGAQATHAVDESTEAILKRLSAKSSTTPDPNYFQKIRLELNKKAAEEQAAAKADGVIVHSLIKLPIDTAGFFVATGAINFMTMWNKAGANPLLFQEQIENLNSGLGHLSFYSFMAANGFYMNYKTKSFAEGMSPEAKALALRRLSYQAMAAGSLASSLVADVGTSIKSCANSWLTVHSKDQKKQEESDRICAQANQTWTARNLTQKYIPQIFSLLIVQGATELLQSGVEKSISVSSKALLNTLLKAGEKAGFEMLFVNIALSANPSRFAIKSFSIVGKITQFTFFVGVDHALNNTLTRGFNNIFKPLIFKNTNQFKLDGYFELAGKNKWNVSDIQKLNPYFETPNGINSVSEYKKDFAEEITNFTTQLQEWRDHLNSDAETDLNAWLSVTNQMINQLQVSENFYKTFLDNLFQTSNKVYRVNLPEGHADKLTKAAFKNITLFPYRPLPLFGVKYIPWKDSNVPEKEAYLSYPSETEKMQSEFLSNVASKLLSENKVKSFHMQKDFENLSTETLIALKDGNPLEQGKALLNFMNHYKLSHVTNNVEFRKFGKFLTSIIGNPEPKLMTGEGFSAAFEFANADQVNSARFALQSMQEKTNVNSASELLLKQMVCGTTTGFIKEHNFELLKHTITTWEPDFMAPSIVTASAKEICKQNGGAAVSENFYDKNLTNSITNKSYKNISEYIAQNIKTEVLGDFRNKDKTADFSSWWSQNVMVNIPSVLQKWDVSYSEIVQDTMNNIFDNKGRLNQTVDSATQFNFFNDNLLSSNLLDSYRYEKEFYLQSIYLVRSKSQFDLPANKRTSLLSEAKKIALNQTSKVLHKLTEPEYVAINNSLEALFAELAKPVTTLKYEDQILSEEEVAQKTKNTELNYKKYLVLQSNFENAVSALESKVGLKKETNDSVFSLPGVAADSNNISYEPIEIKDPSLEQALTQASVAGLRNIESNISKYVRMKILMRRGLTFTKDEINAERKNKLTEACKHSVRGCS